MRSFPTAIALAILLPLAAGAARAATPSMPPPAHLGLCAACHGEHGRAQIPGAPNLGGQNLNYLRIALKHYRDGSRDVPVMRAAIGPLSDAELDALARWYAAQPPVAGTP